ncbi:DUF2198 family protein [Metabacillus fastidiosus]|uniref:DUF2198 family protein n=1 Tax=Metabacillus fastidiosus TaxID=1458 RepID=UPI003D299C80
MLLKAMLAIFLSFLLVLLFTRVTYNHYVGTALTLALLVVFYYEGYSDFTYVIILDLLSLAAGFIYARKMAIQVRKKS